MKYIYTTLLVFITSVSYAQRLSIGAETGFMATTTDKVGVLSFSKATGILYGATGTWYLTPKTALNTGISSSRIEIWPSGRFYQIPLSISYSPTFRGALQKAGPRNYLTNLLTLNFIPQTFEFEGGISLRFYDGKYTHEETQTAILINGTRFEEYTFNIERKNRVFTPAADIGFRWSLDAGNVHFYLRPRFSFLMLDDNLVRVEDFRTKQVTNGGSRFSFAMLAGIYFTFD